MKTLCRAGLAVCALTIGWTLPVQAEDRALLIGTTAYLDPVFDLPGLDLDIAEMQRFARQLGFAEESIRTLTGEAVTAENLRNEFATFLSEGVSASDSLLIYYTGHGLQVADQNGDEEDRRDEVISMYDLAPAARGWKGVMLDDELGELLRALPSDNIVVIVDACHSGTVTRGYSESVEVASLSWGDEPLSIKTLPFRPDPEAAAMATRSAGTAASDAAPAGVVTLSAAQDDEQSYSSSKGSLFTLALGEAFANLDGAPTPRALTRTAAGLLHSRLDEQYLFQPNLTGDAALFEKSIVLGDRRAPAAVNRDEVQSLLRTLPTLSASLVGGDGGFVDGEDIQIDIDVPADGYLNVIAVDPDDAMVLLYPNRYSPDNRVTRGGQRLPGDARFSWFAQPPWGDTMVAVLYSDQPLNLLESSVQRSRDGSLEVDYVLPSMAGFAAIREAAEGQRAALLSARTCARTEDCR